MQQVEIFLIAAISQVKLGLAALDVVNLQTCKHIPHYYLSRHAMKSIRLARPVAEKLYAKSLLFRGMFIQR